MNIDSKALKQAIVEPLLKAKEEKGQGVHNPMRVARLDVFIEALEIILIFISKIEKGEETDMNKLRKELVAKTITLADIPMRSRSSELSEKIVEIVSQLEAEYATAKAKKVSPEKYPAKVVEGITPNHLFAKIKALKKEDKVSQDISVRSSGNVAYLIKK